MSMVIIKTNVGDITLELNPEKAPVTVDNFLKYVADGYYEGTIFHRVIKGFMIQGGGLTAGLKDKASRRAPIENEADNGLKNDKYTIAMARTMDPHSATSQFFINTKDNDFLNHSGKDLHGWGYCVFGKVVDGFDVVDKIESVKTTNKFRPYGDVPVEDIVINEVVAK
ncbi:peptidyl-prolyl cis-trans isomerase B (cyclophilin B) [Ruminobacter amylophilus]|jgi:peptidyl-prolyl cis-trans isomerase B (cyclophilin B)|uniref:Peptidyl-prolyl cis-trans isomerase n=2 Tax=Succinivibrionaceae TaxID=83763 RepID=A0A662ZGK4_9GAMM|nr:peptidyl-prolyl cis-trans isomerase B (cyclophilin B) [Ruminobacter amylophilus]